MSCCSCYDEEFRAGFDNESTAEVLASLEQLRLRSEATNVNSNTIRITIGHQRYLDLDLKVKKNQTEDPPIWNLLKEISVMTLQTIQQIDLNYEFRITSFKDEEKYEKAMQRLHKLVSKLAQRLQRNLQDEQKEVSVDGNQCRVEEPNVTVVTGCASIIIAPMMRDNGN